MQRETNECLSNSVLILLSLKVSRDVCAIVLSPYCWLQIAFVDVHTTDKPTTRIHKHLEYEVICKNV